MIRKKKKASLKAVACAIPILTGVERRVDDSAGKRAVADQIEYKTWLTIVCMGDSN